MNGKARTGRLSRGGWHVLVVLLLLCGVQQIAFAADYVLLVDASVSMLNAVDRQTPRHRVDVVKEALAGFLREVPLESRVYLCAFNAAIWPQAEVVVRSDDDRALLLKAIANLDSLLGDTTYSGNTHLWAALDHALLKGSDYSREYPDRTVLVRVMTDGEDNDPRYRGVRPQSILNKLQEKYPAVDGRAIQANLVLLGSLDFHLSTKGIDSTKSPDFKVVFPPAISYIPNTPRAGKPVVFSDTSNQRFDSYDWSIDGKLVAREKKFTTEFSKAGNYSVHLSATAPNGQREAARAQVVVLEPEKPEPLNPQFTFVPSAPEPKQQIKFYGHASDKAGTATWLIDAAQAGSGFELEKEFPQEGRHDVVLSVRDANGYEESFSNHIIVAEKPLAVAFSSPSEAVSGDEVEFKNLTTGVVSGWKWDFGDQNSSLEQHPTHRFVNTSERAVQYAVVLSARSAAGRPFASEPSRITVHPTPKQPQAAFHISQKEYKVGTLVNFLNDSSGVITNRHWDFAGEGESPLENPEFGFSSPGEKLIRLVVMGPGGSDTATQRILVPPLETLVQVAMAGTNSSDASQLPESLEFGEINTENLRQNTFIGIDNDTIEVLFSGRPEPSASVEVSLAGATNTFQLLLLRDGKLLPLLLPVRLRENALVRVALVTNAPEGKQEAILSFRPDGPALLVNGKQTACQTRLVASVGAIDPSGFFILLFLLVLGLVGWAIYYFWKQRMTLGPKSQVTIGLAERRDETKNAPAAVETPASTRKFKLANGEMIVLGQSPDSPHIYDLQAPDWRIRREAKRIVSVNRRDFKSAGVLKSGDVKEIKTDTGVVRRLAVTIEIGAAPKPQKIAPTKTKGRKQV